MATLAEKKYEDFLANLSENKLLQKEFKQASAEHVEKILKQYMGDQFNDLFDGMINLYQDEIRKGLSKLGPVKPTPSTPKASSKMRDEANGGIAPHPAQKGRDGIAAKSLADWLLQDIRDNAINEITNKNKAKNRMVLKPGSGGKKLDEKERLVARTVPIPRPRGM